MAPAFTWQVLNKELDNTGDSNLQQAAVTFGKAVEKLDLKRYLDVWEMSDGFAVMQTFQMLILYHLSTHHIEHSLCDHAKNLQRIFGHLFCVRDWTCLTSVFC